MSSELWTVQRALEWTGSYLKAHGDARARFSAECLLAQASGLSRMGVYTSFDRPLSAAERRRLREYVARRARHEPLQYILGEVTFRHLTLKVRPGVLIPRPETEVLVDLAREFIDKLPSGHVSGHLRPGTSPPPATAPSLPALSVADLCCGCGCVGLAIADECPQTHISASDLSPGAVALATENAVAAGLASRFCAFEGDLYQPLPPGRFNLIVANPPYIPTAGLDALAPEIADFEPRLALDGGADGLALARRIITAAPDRLRPGGVVLMELDERNVSTARCFAVELGCWVAVTVRVDLARRERFLVLQADTDKDVWG